MRTLCALIGCSLVATTLLTPLHAAQAASLDDCRQEVNLQLAREQRRYRAVLFGHRPAEEAPIGNVRYDTDGDPWVKVEEDKWKAHGLRGVNTVNDDVMDSIKELSQRRGIFETKRVLTSELIPHLTQAMSAFNCRLETVCSIAKQSVFVQEEDPQEVTVSPLGCIPRPVETYPECHLSVADQSPLGPSDAYTYCQEVVEQLLEREASLLKLAVEYDAAYRSLMQLAGNIDLFISEFRWPLKNTMQQAATLMGWLDGIPCFISSCDDYPVADADEDEDEEDEDDEDEDTSAGS